jgi:hypothetical protein
MPVQEIPGTLHGDYSSGDRGAPPDCGLEEVLDRLVCQADQPGEACPPTEEMSETLRERDDHVTMRDGFKNLLGDEFVKGDLALSVTGGAEAAFLARGGEQILVAAVRAADAGKAPGEYPTPVEAV